LKMASGSIQTMCLLLIQKKCIYDSVAVKHDEIFDLDNLHRKEAIMEIKQAIESVLR